MTSPSGAPTAVSRSTNGGVTSFRIGDPDTTVTGRQTYVVSYHVGGALNAFADHDELYWNAIGAGWPVPIASATVQVMTPVASTSAACFAGSAGSGLVCESLTGAGTTTLTASEGGLPAYGAMTVVVALPKGAVAATGPVLEQRWTLRRSLTPTPLTGSLAGLVLLAGLGGVAALVGGRGRDRRFAGVTPGVLDPHSVEERAPARAEAVAVQFMPPEGLRPGQLGTLLDEQANVLDVTATIVDLAVRGHLRIVELPREHWFSSRDWRLERLSGGAGELMEYERLLADGLFASGDVVLLSELKRSFAGRMKQVQDALYVEVTKAGWFRGRPDSVRAWWKGAGLAVAVAGGWSTYLLWHQLHWAPVGIALSFVGIVLVVLSSRMAARTARGNALLVQARGFRTYIQTAEAEQLRFEEGADIFSRYLPFAVVFGETERWVRVFGPLAAAGAVGGAGTSAYWYVGPSGWDMSHFGDSLNGFAASTSSTIAAATPSSSGGSGFSGGGGGGGGGGSW